MTEAVEKVEPDAEERVEVAELERVEGSSKELPPTLTSFAFSWLISRLAGTLPRLVETVVGVEAIEVEVAKSKRSFPLLFFSDCVPFGLIRSFRKILFSPMSGACSASASKEFFTATGAGNA